MSCKSRRAKRLKPGARPRPQQRHGALTRQLQKVCIARAQTACAVARAKEVEEARLAAAKAEAAGEQKAKEAHAAAMKAAEEGTFSFLLPHPTDLALC